MSSEILKRDQNFVTVLAGVTNDSAQDITMLRVDPISKRLLITGSISGGVVTQIVAGTGISISPIGGTGIVTITNSQSLTGYVPTSRTLTINGITYDLTANRSWSIAAESNNFSYQTIATGIIITIPIYQQMIVHNEVDIIGTLIEDGELVII